MLVVPIHDRTKLNHMLVSSDPSLVGILLQAPLVIYLVQTENGLDGKTLSTFGIGT